MCLNKEIRELKIFGDIYGNDGSLTKGTVSLTHNDTTQKCPSESNGSY